MFLEIKDLKQPLGDQVQSKGAVSEADVRMLAAKRLRIGSDQIGKIRILKKSIDARKKDQINLIYTVAAEIKDGKKTKGLANGADILLWNEEKPVVPIYGNEKIINRPIIIGSGPAGLFAGLILAGNGYQPIILERGKRVEDRTRDIEDFFKSGELNTESNVQFGEGGAGTFSDGKLTTRIKDPRCEFILNRLVDFGAPAEIAYLNKPHIGTDILKNVIRNMRNEIIRLGGEFRFSSCVTDILVEHGKISGVIVNKCEQLESNVVIAALGHSARDTYEMLFAKGITMIAKPFSIGVRIEHPQEMIDQAQYGRFAGHPALGAADYVLTFRSKTTGRSAYSFCMCPGGTVVAAASEKGMLVTNGMSEYKRDKENANSALVVSVSPEDFENDHPLAGIRYQRFWESKAYAAGGGEFYAPVQRVADFTAGIDNKNPAFGANLRPSYMPGVRGSSMDSCLPGYITTTLREALADFDRKIKGFARPDALLTGIETRTSAPLRMVRAESLESESLANFYPAGEGAGYAGGIISAAVDGMKCAERIIGRFAPLV